MKKSFSLVRKLPRYACLMLAALLFCSCSARGKSDMEQLAAQLTSASSRQEVQQLFNVYQCINVLHRQSGFSLGKHCIILRENVPAVHLEVYYNDLFFLSCEQLTIYYDEDWNVIAYCYELPS